jgi:hypothetical protein
MIPRRYPLNTLWVSQGKEKKNMKFLKNLMPMKVDIMLVMIHSKLGDWIALSSED